MDDSPSQISRGAAVGNNNGCGMFGDLPPGPDCEDFSVNVNHIAD